MSSFARFVYQANGDASSSKADGKRPANGSSASEGVHLEGQEGVVMKRFASKDFATSYAELRCKEDQKFTVCPAGAGRFLLLLGPV